MKNSKRILALFVVLLTTIISIHAQTNQKPRPFCGFNLKDGYYYQQRQEYITRLAKPGDESGIADVVEQIRNKIGIDIQIYVYIAKAENNCYATIGQGGKRLIIADHLFLNDVNNSSGTRWAAISVIAHELGHHIAGFSRHPSQLDNELDADYWSGYILQKLGASEDASTKCIMRFGTEQDTESHPNKYRRAGIIRNGWEDASRGVIDQTKCDNCVSN